MVRANKSGTPKEFTLLKGIPRDRRPVPPKRKPSAREIALLNVAREMLSKVERHGYDALPNWLDSVLCDLTTTVADFEADLEKSRYVSTTEAAKHFGVGNSFLGEQAVAGHLLLGVHYLIASDGDQDRVHRIWNIRAIEKLWGTDPALRPLPKRKNPSA